MIFILPHLTFLLFIIYDAEVKTHVNTQRCNFSDKGIYILRLLDTTKFLLNMPEPIFRTQTSSRAVQKLISTYICPNVIFSLFICPLNVIYTHL